MSTILFKGIHFVAAGPHRPANILGFQVSQHLPIPLPQAGTAQAGKLSGPPGLATPTQSVPAGRHRPAQAGTGRQTFWASTSRGLEDSMSEHVQTSF